jgi:serine/threonine protein kinase
MSITLDEFIESVTVSGIMDAEEVASFLDTLPMESRPRTAEELAKELYRLGKLTKFQAQAIYQKKTRGLVVGNYVVLDKLGKGGMGAVYKARHKRMDRIVALKMLPSSATRSQDAVQRFQRETRAAAKLSHPNIVTAYDADEAKGVYFLVMEYVDGQDLHALVKEHGTISAARAVDYIVQAAKGLEYAHSQGVIHRDIKPHNLLLDKKGTVKILDMGLARIGEGAAGDAVDDDGLTRSGQVMGTLDYMSPEQALDTKTVDVRTDIYSLGCTLHYLLIGRSPYGGDTVGKKMLAHRMETIPSLHKLRDDVPESLDAVFHKMMAKEPKDRQQSMTEVIRELQACAMPQEICWFLRPCRPALVPTPKP